MKWTILSLNLDISVIVNLDVSKNQNRIENSEDPDETAHREPSH